MDSSVNAGSGVRREAGFTGHGVGSFGVGVKGPIHSGVTSGRSSDGGSKEGITGEFQRSGRSTTDRLGSDVVCVGVVQVHVRMWCVVQGNCGQEKQRERN